MALNFNTKFDPSCDEDTEDLGVDPARPLIGGGAGSLVSGWARSCILQVEASIYPEKEQSYN